MVPTTYDFGRALAAPLCGQSFRFSVLTFRKPPRDVIVSGTGGDRVALHCGWFGIRARLGGDAGCPGRYHRAGNAHRRSDSVRSVRRRVVGNSFARIAVAPTEWVVNLPIECGNQGD